MMCVNLLLAPSYFKVKNGNNLLALLLKVVDVDIPSDDCYVLESLFGGCSVDVEFLSFGV